MGKEILVSVIVLSYNSEDTILDTLNSIYNQTYKKIELIITDDCSKDNTKEVVQKWIDSYGERFISVKTNFKKKNSGVAVNGDEGIKLSSGKWIKCIAADDKLMESCIESNLRYAYANKAQILFSNMHYMRNGEMIQKAEDHLIKKLKTFSVMDVRQQYKKLLKENPLPAPTAFFSRKLYDMVEGFDKDICMIEDWPFWLKVTKSGVHISYCDNFTVIYRMSDSSISHSANFWREAKKIKVKYCYPNISRMNLFYYYHEKWHDMRWFCRNKVDNHKIMCILIELLFGIFWPPYLFQYMKTAIHLLLNTKDV